MKKYYQYCEDVISGKIVTGSLMRLSVERHLNDLDKSSRREIPYRFSEAHADHVIDFMEKMKHTKGILANQYFLLSPIQQFMTAVMFGWLMEHEDTGRWVRRFTKSYVEVARKWGKTAWMAAGGNYLLYGDGEEGAEVFSFATKLEQARIVHRQSRSMTNKFLRENPILRSQIEVLKDNITYFPTESMYEPLPSTSDKLDGLNPHGGLGDEIHEFDSPDMINVLETGMGSRLMPMLWLITTAGFNIYGPGYKIRSDQVKVLKGINTDDRTVSFINTIDEGDSWEDESVWPKSNPHIGITPYWSYMRQQYRKARNEGGRTEIEFKTKNLNIWTTSGDTWIQDELWVKNQDIWSTDILRGRVCTIGMDLSANKDLTVLAAFFPATEEDLYDRVLLQYYCPSDTIPERSKSDRVNYDIWAQEGYILPIPGSVIRYEYLQQTLREWKQLYNIKKLAYDPKFAYQLVDEIERIGIDTAKYGQNTRDMTAPIQYIERQLLSDRFKHNMHPILRWNVSNVMLYTDSNGGVKFDKRKTVDKIDGCVAMAMAAGEWLSSAPPRMSRYIEESMFPGM